MQRISTFYQAETKLQDLVMVFIKQSFSGKSKAVVAMIADDMNHYENQPEGSMNFHELIQKYSVHLATAGADTGSEDQLKINYAGDAAIKQCDNCGKTGHVKKDCWATGGGSVKKKCDYCSIPGHVKSECHRFKAGVKPGDPLPPKIPAESNVNLVTALRNSKPSGNVNVVVAASAASLFAAPGVSANPVRDSVIDIDVSNIESRPSPSSAIDLIMMVNPEEQQDQADFWEPRRY